MEEIAEEPFEKVQVIPISEVDTAHQGVRLRPWQVVRRKIVPEGVQGARDAEGNSQQDGFLLLVKKLIFDLPERWVFLRGVAGVGDEAIKRCS